MLNAEKWILLVSCGDHVVGPRGQKVQWSLFSLSSLCHSWRGLIALQTAVHHRECLLLGPCLEKGPTDSALNIYLTDLYIWDCAVMFSCSCAVSPGGPSPKQPVCTPELYSFVRRLDWRLPAWALPAWAMLWAYKYVLGQESRPERELEGGG